MPNLTTEEYNRLRELEDKAVKNFMEYTPFNPSEWLDTAEEKEEYERLYEAFMREMEGSK